VVVTFSFLLSPLDTSVVRFGRARGLSDASVPLIDLFTPLMDPREAKGPPNCCAKLLQQVYQKGTRTHELLSSLADLSTIQHTPDGFTVNFKAKDTTESLQEPPIPLIRRDSNLLATSSTDDESTTPLTVTCRPCANTGPEAHARAFVMGPHPLSIVVCTNRLHENKLDEIMVHELVHVHDIIVRGIDLRDCRNLAYSEIRAAAQAECYGVPWAQSCIRSKALAATRNLCPTQALEALQSVWKEALNDTRPFAKETGKWWKSSGK